MRDAKVTARDAPVESAMQWRERERESSRCRRGVGSTLAHANGTSVKLNDVAGAGSNIRV